MSEFEIDPRLDADSVLLGRCDGGQLRLMNDARWPWIMLVPEHPGISQLHELEAATAHLSAAFREMDTVCRLLDFQRVVEVHITADSDWADLWLVPRLERFQAENPNTLFCINGVGDVPVRLGQADCEVWFGAERDAAVEDVLFHDYLVPVSSPTNTERVASLPKKEMLEGFPLLHLDCYTLDGGAIGWEEWISEYGYRKTAPGRGIRYKKVMHALEAVYADAGFVLCGLGLVKTQLDDGKLSRPFPASEGEWSSNAYRVSFGEGSLRRGKIVQFRDWLVAEAQATRNELENIAAG